MLKNKIIVRKIRNIVILIMAIAVMFGAYRFIDRSKAEKVIEIGAIALDDYGYLDEEEVTLEAKQLEDNLYEVQLPDSINTKKINRIVKIGLGELTENEVTTQENESQIILEDGLELVENRIYLTKEQIENQKEKINLEVVYDIAILEQKEDGTINKTLLAEKNEEERKQLEANGVINVEEIKAGYAGTTQGQKVVYSKILRYEEEANNKLVELKGYLPLNAELQVEKVSQEKLNTIFIDQKIEVAYDIKILVKVVTQVPADEAADPNAKPEEIVETIEIKPEDFGETCEISITDVAIQENSQVYHVKDDNSFEEVTVKENVNGKISFEANTFSIYAISSGPKETEFTGPIEQEGMNNGDTTVSAASTITASTLTKNDYGGFVKNYAAPNGANTGRWRIFYSDGTNIYLISEEFIHEDYIPAGKKGTKNSKSVYRYGIPITAGVDYTGTGDINSTLKTKLLGQYASYTDTTDTGKAIAYLMDTNAWSGFTDTQYADYAIGGPTLDLLVSSWNKVTTGTKTQMKIESYYPARIYI